MTSKISARVLADSIFDNHRLTTLEVTFPRIILAEFNTHRVFSRNSASSRAIPFAKTVQKIMNDPYIPEHIGVNKPGMSPEAYLEGEELEAAQQQILKMRDTSVLMAIQLAQNSNIDLQKLLPTYNTKALIERALKSMSDEPRTLIHKQTINRYLEPFMWHTAIVSATEWDNFFLLRDNENAQYEIAELARRIKEARNASTPEIKSEGDWHVPFSSVEERAEIYLSGDTDLLLAAAARCARVSYENHHGVRSVEDDIRLGSSLFNNGHMSPFEHVAIASTEPASSNFKGWTQLRHIL